MIHLADLKRHTRSLVWNADDGLLLWEILRKTPEGITCGTCRSEKGKEIIAQYGRTLDDLDKPVLEICEGLFSDEFLRVIESFAKNGIEFDRIFLRDPFSSCETIEKFAQIEKNLKEKYGGAEFVVSQRIPKSAQRLSDLIYNQILRVIELSEREELLPLLEKMKSSEEAFFSDSENPLFSWDENTVRNALGSERVQQAKTVLNERRRITSGDVSRWFDEEKSSYGKALFSSLGAEGFARIKSLLLRECEKRVFQWQSDIFFFRTE